MTATATPAGWAALALALAEEAGAGLPEVPGGSGVVELVLTGAGEGDVAMTLGYLDGRIARAELGAPASADLTLTLPAADARAVLDGSLAPSVAFMRGRLKTAGDPGLVLAVLAGSTGERWQGWLASVRALASESAPAHGATPAAAADRPGAST